MNTMRSSNQFTLEEAKKIMIGDADSITEDSDLYMQGEHWGSEDAVGEMEDWEEEIPEDESEAESTGWFDWYVSDERYDHGMTWAEYREELLNKDLIPVEIVEEEADNP